MESKPASRPVCSTCSGPVIGHGKDRKGNPRFLCKACDKRFTVAPPRPLGSMRIPLEKAVLCLNLLVEGSSIRSAERITGVHRDTICRLLVQVGGKCEALLERMVKGVEVKDVQADEIWNFVAMKEKERKRQKIDSPKVGDAWTYVGIERESKLALTFHLGRRDSQHTDAFAEKLAVATAGRFQLTTDGWASYPQAMGYHLGERTDYAMLVKEYGSQGTEEQRRYSPPQIIGIEKTRVHGDPDEDRICTSHVERNNLTMRMSMRRFTRLTNGFSKKWENLRAALALHFAHYNFCRMHSSIRMTPAIKAGLTNRPWSLAELLMA